MNTNIDPNSTIQIPEYQKLKEVGKPFCWSDIRRISGVKKKNFHLTIPYLQQHTDTKTSNQIIALIEKQGA